jgi:type VI secretion system protein
MLLFHRIGLCIGLALTIFAIGSQLSATAFLPIAKVWLRQVTLKPAVDMNGNSALIVHIVIVSDSKTLEALSKMDSSTYFAQTAKLQANDPSHEKFQVWSVDLIPGQKEKTLEIKPDQMTNIGGFVFANYATKGEHRLVLGPAATMTIAFDSNDFAFG